MSDQLTSEYVGGMDWLAQCQDNVTKWDVRAIFPVGQHYKLTMSAHWHT